MVDLMAVKRNWNDVDRDVLLSTIINQQETIKHLKIIILLIIIFTIAAGMAPEGSYVGYTTEW
jgi:hypothetical protein